jgi:hypothetical protein
VGAYWRQAESGTSGNRVCAPSYFPDDPEYRDARRAALAALGDTEGAIRDLEYLAHERRSHADSAAEVAKRVEWIESLRSGKNLFR